jgi:LysR family nitrogen assimilation transcriptional regulator
MSHITTKQLRYLLAIARSGSFTAASHLLNVSQPALGLQIRALEEHLGTDLLLRGARGVELSASGRKFLIHAEAILNLMDIAEEDVRRLSRSQIDDIELGVTPTCGRALFEHLLHGETTRQAPFRLRLLEGLSDELLKYVQTGRLHCAFCYDVQASETYDAIPMFEEDLVLVGRRDLVSRPELSFKDLERYPLVLGPNSSASRRAISAMAEEQKASLDVRMEIVPISLKRDILIRRGFSTIVPYGLFLSEIESGVLGASRLIPGIRRIMSLVIRRDAPGALIAPVVRAARAGIDGHVREGRLGWRLPDVAAGPSYKQIF